MIVYSAPTRVIDGHSPNDIERYGKEAVVAARGLSNDQIGEALSISSFTVKTHVNRAMVKLDAHDRAQLVVFAYQARLLQPE